MNSDVDYEHTISRPTVFYTSDGEKFQKKDCDFYIYGRNSNTQNRILVVASKTSYDMTPFINKGKVQERIFFENSKATNTYIEIEWNITTEMHVAELDLDNRRLSIASPAVDASQVEDLDQENQRLHDEIKELLADQEGQ